MTYPLEGLSACFTFLKIWRSHLWDSAWLTLTTIGMTWRPLTILNFLIWNRKILCLKGGAQEYWKWRAKDFNFPEETILSQKHFWEQYEITWCYMVLMEMGKRVVQKWSLIDATYMWHPFQKLFMNSTLKGPRHPAHMFSGFINGLASFSLRQSTHGVQGSYRDGEVPSHLGLCCLTCRYFLTLTLISSIYNLGM